MLQVHTPLTAMVRVHPTLDLFPTMLDTITAGVPASAELTRPRPLAGRTRLAPLQTLMRRPICGTQDSNAGQQGCGTSTDVYWATFSAALDGSYQCQVVVSAGRCDRSLVQIDPGNMSPSDADWKQTTCHELGHSAGMGHMTTDCLGTSTSLQSYNSTHRGHVNDTF